MGGLRAALLHGAAGRRPLCQLLRAALSVWVNLGLVKSSIRGPFTPPHTLVVSAVRASRPPIDVSSPRLAQDHCSSCVCENSLGVLVCYWPLAAFLIIFKTLRERTKSEAIRSSSDHRHSIFISTILPTISTP